MHETLDCEHVHLFGARAVHWADHHRWRGTRLRIHRPTVRHTHLPASSCGIARILQAAYFLPFSGYDGQPASALSFTSAPVLVFASSRRPRTAFFPNATPPSE